MDTKDRLRREVLKTLGDLYQIGYGVRDLEQVENNLYDHILNGHYEESNLSDEGMERLAELLDDVVEEDSLDDALEELRWAERGLMGAQEAYDDVALSDHFTESDMKAAMDNLEAAEIDARNLKQRLSEGELLP